MRILNYIPCKTSSVRIKKKNIKLFKDKRLVDYTIKFAKESKKKILLSSDNEDLLKSVDVDFKHLRKGNTDNPNLSNLEVLKILAKENYLKKFDFVCLLQPTHPLRRLIDYNNILEYVTNDNTPLVSTINHKNINNSVKKHKIIIDGSYYIFSKDFLLGLNLKKKIKYNFFQIPNILNVNIDTDEDERYFLNLLKNTKKLRSKGYSI